MSNRKNFVKKPLSRRICRFMKRNIFNKRAAQGSVTIFLIIIMLPMLIFSCSVMDICKIFMARNSTDGALEIAMNSRLASYDDILKDMYGILASSADEEELSKKLTTYYKMTLESSTGSTLGKDDEKYVENFFSELFKADFSDLNDAASKANGLLNVFEADDSPFSVTPIATSAVSNPDVMHKQIVEYMKYRGPVYLATGVLDKIKAFADTKNQAAAAKKQIEFEQDMEDAGNAFKDVYDNIVALMNEADVLEQTYNFSGFYTANTMHPHKDILDYMNILYLPSAYTCTIFADVFYDNGELIYEDFASDAFSDDYDEESYNDKAIDELEEYLSEIEDIENAAEDAEKIFEDNVFGLNFIKNNSSLSDSNRAVELLTDYFGALFDGFSYSESRDVYYFLKAYNDARGRLNYIESRLKTKITDNERKRLKKEKDEAESAIGKAERIVDKIEKAAKSIKGVIEYDYNDILRQNFEPDMEKMFNIHQDVNSQIKRLDFLLGDDGIDKIVKELESASIKAEEYKKAIGEVKVEDTKAAMQGVYEKNAAKVNEVAGKCPEGLNELKAILESLRNVYSAQKQCIESMQFLSDSEYNVSNKVVEDSLIRKKINDYLKDFSKGHSSSGVQKWYSFERFYSDFSGIDFNSSLTGNGLNSTFFSFGTKLDVENLQKWNSKNADIKDNAFYQLVKENAGGNSKEKTEEEKNAKSEAKKQKEAIEKMGKEASKDSDNGENPSSGDEAINDNEADEALKFIPKNYPTFMDYINDVKAVFNGGGEKDDLLSELNENSFSLEKSETIDNLTTGKNEMSDLKEGSKNLLDNIGEFFSNLLTATRDNLYIAEYLTENFPCVTTCKNKENTAQMISGEMFYSNGNPTVVCVHSSLEYILYGDMDGDEGEPAASVIKSSAVLFGVRFVLNLIYALTSADLALQIEPIIAPLEAIPFAAPIARTVILIGLALGESAIDVGLLLTGEKVALFKNTLTWVCSPSGFARKAGEIALDKMIDEGINLATNELIKAEDALATSLSDGVDNIQNEVDAYAEEMLKSMREEIENDVFNPIFTTIRSFVTEINSKAEGFLPDKEEVKNNLSESINTAKEHLGLNDASANDDLVRKAEIEIFAFLESKINEFSGVIYDNLSSFVNKANTAVNDKIDALETDVKDKLSSLVDKIEEQFDKTTGKLSKAVKEKVNSVATELKGQTKKTGENLKATLKSNINEKVRGTKPAASGVNLSKSSDGNKLLDVKDGDKLKTDKSLCVSYEDYMYVFTVLGLALNEDAMLMRAAQLMNANIELRIVGSARAEAPQNAYNSVVSYNINKAYTLFKGEAGSKARTMFLGTTWNRENQQWIFPFSNVYKYKSTTYVGY